MVSRIPLQYCEPLQSNGWKTGDRTTAIAREQLCGLASPATREHAIIEENFSLRYLLGLHNEDYLLNPWFPRFGASQK
jgi:hypothetical protein